MDKNYFTEPCGLVELATDMRAINDSVFHAADRIADILDRMELP